MSEFSENPFEDLPEALKAAFDVEDLKILVHGMDSAFVDSVKWNGSLEYVVFDVVKSAERHGELRELLAAAFKKRPRDRRLAELAEKHGLGTTEKVAPQIDRELWNVPFPRNKDFVGRGTYLEEIRKRLTEKKSATIGQAIRGLGGIGKTETAVEYAYRHRADYKAAFWVEADSKTSIPEGYKAIYSLLSPEIKGVKSDEAVERVLLWLNRNSDWLLIFDNADEPNLLKDYLPGEGSGHVLLTSRANTFRGLNLDDPIELPTWDNETAVEFLLKSTSREDATGEEKEAASELANELDGLPLALEQAAAFIEQGATFVDYLASYRKRTIDWLKKGSAESRGYPDSVAKTWIRNFEAVGKVSAASVDLLRMTAFLYPNDIPFELFTRDIDLGNELKNALDGVGEDPLKLSEVLHPLARFSLLTIDAKQKTYSVHRLVQEVTKQSLEPVARRTWSERVIDTINSAFPNPGFSNWPQCQRLVPHADIATRYISEFDIETIQGSRLASSLASYLTSQGQFPPAEPLYQQALEIRRDALGEVHPEYATTLNNLAGLYEKTGRYAEAEPLYQQALEIRRTALGEEHPDYAETLNDLAGLYDLTGRYAEADMLYQQALEIRRTALGEEHPDYAETLNDLAGLYDLTGRYAEADMLYQKALEIRRTVLGEDHPDYAATLNNLADLCESTGRYAEAEPLYQQDLEITRNALGEEHPDYATTLNNLAGLYEKTDRYAEAEPLFLKALKIRRNALGENHPDYATTLNDLAGLYESTGRYAEAEPHYQQALEITRIALGEEHPDYATTLNNLAGLYETTGRYGEAEPLFLQALEITCKALGQEHPDCATTLDNLAGLYETTGRYAEAEPLYQQSLEIRRIALGEDHPDYATTLDNLAELYESIGRHEEAQRLRDFTPKDE